MCSGFLHAAVKPTRIVSLVHKMLEKEPWFPGVETLIPATHLPGFSTEHYSERSLLLLHHAANAHGPVGNRQM